MNLLISNAYAQGAPAAAPGGGPMPLIMMAALFVAMYFLIMRPQQKRMKELKEMLAKLAVGDEVATTGGLLGRITELGDSVVTLEIATGVNVRLQRAQISQVLPKGTLKNG